MMHPNPNSCGLMLVLTFADGFQLTARIFEFSRSHPFSGVLDFVARQHGRCIGVSMPGDATPIVPDLSPILAPPLFSENETATPKTQVARA